LPPAGVFGGVGRGDANFVAMGHGDVPRDLSDFVPEGLNDRSDSTELAEVQAIYRLERDQSRIRPVGYGLILIPG